MLTWILITWLLLCVLTDMCWRKLPNVLTLGMYIPALFILIYTHQTALGGSYMSAIAGWFIAIVLTMPAYAIRWLGAGDVKLISVMGLIGGLNFILFSFVLASLATLLIILTWQSCQKFFPYFNLKLSRWGYRLPAVSLIRGRIIPFGAMLAMGAIVTLLFSMPKPLPLQMPIG
jgi:prepilin peptidase CpaA